MNQTAKLALIIGGIVSALAGLATLGVVYAKFEKAQKTVKQTTLGDVLRAEKLNHIPEEVIPVFAEGDAEKVIEDLAKDAPEENAVAETEEGVLVTTPPAPVETVFDAKVEAAAKKLEKQSKVVSIDDKKGAPQNG